MIEHGRFDDLVARDVRDQTSCEERKLLMAELDRWCDYLGYLLDDCNLQLQMRKELPETDIDSTWKVKVLGFKRSVLRKELYVRALIAERDGGVWRSDDAARN